MRRFPPGFDPTPIFLFHPISIVFEPFLRSLYPSQCNCYNSNYKCFYLGLKQNLPETPKVFLQIKDIIFHLLLHFYRFISKMLHRFVRVSNSIRIQLHTHKQKPGFLSFRDCSYSTDEKIATISAGVQQQILQVRLRSLFYTNFLML